MENLEKLEESPINNNKGILNLRKKILAVDLC